MKDIVSSSVGHVYERSYILVIGRYMVTVKRALMNGEMEDVRAFFVFRLGTLTPTSYSCYPSLYDHLGADNS